MIRRCPLCEGEISTPPKIQWDKVPVSVAHLPSRPNLDCARGTIALVECSGCGFVFNQAFDPMAMVEAYRSPHYRLKKIVTDCMSAALKETCRRLISLLPESGTVLEIGCGDGTLARSLARAGLRVVTVDPALSPREIQLEVPGITHYQAFFEEAAPQLALGRFDLVILRHFLEHVAAPGRLFDQIFPVLADHGKLYLELPNFHEILSAGRWYDIFHDHFGYYSRMVLEWYLNERGFTLLEEGSLFRGQHVWLTFLRGTTTSAPIRPVSKTNWEILDRHRSQVEEVIGRSNGRIALWGAGAHGNAIFSYLTSTSKSRIECCFDKDPTKQGRYLMGGAVIVLPPDPAVLRNFNLLILASALYEDEIVEELARQGFPGWVLRTAKNIEVQRF